MTAVFCEPLFSDVIPDERSDDPGPRAVRKGIGGSTDEMESGQEERLSVTWRLMDPGSGAGKTPRGGALGR
ncbi:hypothetical protein PsAD5_05597 [Pseudovibrio sp. Ad5]|uniref:hypothetical protein n=1 Tax=Pseudovibrio sp. Ad5 TaxID=989436 RepID=UPI0007B18DA4|nr:hypothetical protein [Pseudovibrio sp. Ad5]KZK89235.1 hypothetical protein PsAD5_05597 [Pseudovibrio sp. Ad5]